MKLFLAMPVGRDLPWQTVASLTYLMRSSVWQAGWEFKMLTGSADLTDARNRLTAEFLRSGCDRMLWVDSDMVFQPEDVARVASHDEDVVGGLYCKKLVGDPDYVCQGFPGQERATADARGLIEVTRIGTGFLCIQREAFLFLQDQGLGSMEVYVDEQGRALIDYWDMGFVGVRQKRTRMGEDYCFCDRWRRVGGKIWVDTRCQLGHVGSVVFPVGNSR